MIAHIRNFAPHVHGVLLMPQDMGEIIKGVSALSQAGVDDIWLIASDVSNTIMGLQAIRTVLKSNHAGVLGLPQDVGSPICCWIAEKCNFWRYWTQTSEVKTYMNSTPSMTWFSTVKPKGNIDPRVNVACYGDPLATEPGAETRLNMIVPTAQTALCGHITPEIIKTHRHRFGFYVISPFAGRDSNAWSLHADPDLVRAVCDEAMVLKEEMAEGMDVLR
jgi:hypothetical protein